MTNYIEWLFSHNPTTESEIRKIGKEMGVIFPEDYIECAKNSHGGHPSLDTFDFKGRSEAMFDQLLSYDATTKGYILNIYKYTRDRLADNIVPFASDPFGNLICFMFEEGEKDLISIVFWNHETAETGKYAGISKICSTFSELLSMLYV